MNNTNQINTPPVERTWMLCPHCGAKTVVADNAANCSGVFLKCTRGCKQVFELIIRNGKQIKNK